MVCFLLPFPPCLSWSLCLWGQPFSGKPCPMSSGALHWHLQGETQDGRILWNYSEKYPGPSSLHPGHPCQSPWAYGGFDGTWLCWAGRVPSDILTGAPGTIGSPPSYLFSGHGMHGHRSGGQTHWSTQLPAQGMPYPWVTSQKLAEFWETCPRSVP